MSETAKKKPVVWVLEGERVGDNSQARALSQALGWPVCIKKLTYRQLYQAPNIALGASLASVKPSSKASLRPPWPDLVIGVGRRSVPVGRWIRRQSGGRSKLVQIGRPRAPLEWFDLVISTPQYGLPAHPKLLLLTLPLTAPVKPDSETGKWREDFSTLQRPWIGILVGGSSSPYRLDVAAARQLAAAVSDRARALGASLLVSTSPRTAQDVIDVLRNELAVPAYVHAWSQASPNPHWAILELADRFVVTCESVSMLAEACRTGKPVELFDVPRGFKLSWQSRSGPGAWLARTGLLSPPRDVCRLHERLLAEKRISRLGCDIADARTERIAGLDEACERVRALFEGA